MIEKIKEKTQNSLACAKGFFFWLLLGLLAGASGGLVGTVFSKALSFVTNLREEHIALLFLLPLGGLLSVLIYKLCKVSDVGTNQVLLSLKDKKPVSPLLTPAIFLGACITHFFGGSAGREGAALQIGGGISSTFGRLLKLDEKTVKILTLASMGAVFSALFGTPLGACIFVLEIINVGSLFTPAIFPCIISSFTASVISRYCGIKPERFTLSTVPEASLPLLFKVLLIIFCCAVASIIFCKSLHLGEKYMKKVFANPYLRIFTGGLIIVFLTLILGTYDYNGGGIHIIEEIFHSGHVRYEAFALKILFTVITVAAGFKGGEIVPTLFIGATLGATLACLTGIPPAFGAAIGMASLFCGVTNCTLGTIIISIELFSAEGLIYFAMAAVLARLLSGSDCLYKGQDFSLTPHRNPKEVNPS